MPDSCHSWRDRSVVTAPRRRLLSENRGSAGVGAGWIVVGGGRPFRGGEGVLQGGQHCPHFETPAPILPGRADRSAPEGLGSVDGDDETAAEGLGSADGDDETATEGLESAAEDDDPAVEGLGSAAEGPWTSNRGLGSAVDRHGAAGDGLESAVDGDRTAAEGHGADAEGLESEAEGLRTAGKGDQSRPEAGRSAGQRVESVPDEGETAAERPIPAGADPCRRLSETDRRVRPSIRGPRHMDRDLNATIRDLNGSNRWPMVVEPGGKGVGGRRRVLVVLRVGPEGRRTGCAGRGVQRVRSLGRGNGRRSDGPRNLSHDDRRWPAAPWRLRDLRQAKTGNWVGQPIGGRGGWRVEAGGPLGLS